MPRYKVQASDGKTLTIEADNEAALDEAMAEYEASARPQAIAPTATQQEAPGMGERMAQGALAGAVPGYSTYQAVRGGDGVDIASAASGDIANLAMLGLAGPQRLVAQTALGGAMGAAGGALAPVAQKMGQAGRGAMESVFGTAQDSPSVAMNMLRNAPGMVGETLGELGPQAAIAFLTGKIAKGAAKGPAPIPEAAQALAREGGQPTAAMRATGPVSKSVLGAAEVSARTNPLLGGKFRSIDEANAMASRSAAQQRFGADVTEPGMNVTAGRELQTSLGNLAQGRSADYQAGLDAMRAKLGGVKDIDAAVKKAKGLGPSMAKAIDLASQDVLPSVAEMFGPLRKKLASGNLTPRQIELELQDLRHKFDGQYASLKQTAPGSHNALDRSFGQINTAIKDAYYEGLNRVSKGMGDVLREIKGDYAEASQAMSPLSKALSFKGGQAPEASATKLMEAGTESLQALKDEMAPADWANTRQQIAKTILDKAKGKEGISAAKLKTLLNSNKNIRDIIPIVFGEGAELGDMRSLIDMMETAKQNELGVVNPSGTFSQTAKLGQLGALLNPSLWPALGGKMALDTAYTYGAVPAQNAIRGLQSALAPAAQRVASNRATQVAGRVGLSTARANQEDKIERAKKRAQQYMKQR